MRARATFTAMQTCGVGVVKFFIRLAIATIFAATAAICAHAETRSPTAFIGRWAVKAEGQNLMVLTLDLPDGKETITGALYRPSHMNLSGGTVTSVSLPVAVEKVITAEITSEGLDLDIQDDSGSVTKFQMTLRSSSAADMKLVGLPMPAWPLVRVGQDAGVAPVWDVQRIYILRDIQADNTKMMQLFADDQADRKRNPPMDLNQLAADDAERMRMVGDMMRKDELRTGLDFLNAAFIFQHGEQPNDYLLAHALALSALRLGRADAGWIAAASLDRYLISKGQPQIYGTQFDEAGQAPVERDLIPDTLRRQMSVPELKDQSAPLVKP